MKQGDLELYWIPQMPMKAFRVPVKDVWEAAKILVVLADYDLFQYENYLNDYSYMGGLEVYNGEEWEEWSDYVDDFFCESIQDLIYKLEEVV